MNYAQVEFDGTNILVLSSALFYYALQNGCMFHNIQFPESWKELARECVPAQAPHYIISALEVIASAISSALDLNTSSVIDSAGASKGSLEEKQECLPEVVLPANILAGGAQQPPHLPELEKAESIAQEKETFDEDGVSDNDSVDDGIIDLELNFEQLALNPVPQELLLSLNNKQKQMHRQAREMLLFPSLWLR